MAIKEADLAEANVCDVMLEGHSDICPHIWTFLNLLVQVSY
jgi:hypothetical protein